VRVAAVGDVHARSGSEERLSRAFAALHNVDLVLLAGDLTATGEADDVVALAEACRQSPAPVAAVLGNHDWHAGRQAEITAVLEEAGVRVLDRDHAIFDAEKATIGVAGTKGFVGGFLDSRLPDFGEPLLREVYAETEREVEALERGLVAIESCDFRIVLLHYSPTQSTIRGEREAIWAFLGSDRLAGPVAKHAPDLVVHGHGHAGNREGAIGAIPVYNVARPVIRKDFRLFALPRRPAPPAARPRDAAAAV
jgi:uncharacterized protein